jgi:hypothetical protein
MVLGAERLLHLELLELVAGEDHQALDVGRAFQDRAREGLAERAGAAGD